MKAVDTGLQEKPDLCSYLNTLIMIWSNISEITHQENFTTSFLYHGRHAMYKTFCYESS